MMTDFLARLVGSWTLMAIGDRLLVLWVTIGMFCGVVVLARRTIATLAHWLAVDLNDARMMLADHGVIGSSERYEATTRLAHIYRLSMLEGRHVDQMVISKAQECSQSMASDSFEQEVLADALGDWTRNEFASLGTNAARRWFVDTLAAFFAYGRERTHQLAKARHVHARDKGSDSTEDVRE